MIDSITSTQDKFGFYQVGALQTYSKARAVEYYSTADADKLKIAQQVFSTVLSLSNVIEQLNNLGVRGQQPVPANFLTAERRKYTQILRNATINRQ